MKYLPEHDMLYISSMRNVSGLDNSDSAEDDQQCLNDNDDQTQGVSMTYRVNTSFKAFYLHNALPLILDSGAETNMIRETVAKSIGAKICKNSQLYRLADGLTPLKVIGETHLVLSRGATNLHLDALVVEDLDVQVRAGTQLLVSNEISSRPAKSQITKLLAKPLYTTVTRIPTAPSVTRFVERSHMCSVLLLCHYCVVR